MEMCKFIAFQRAAHFHNLSIWQTTTLLDAFYNFFHFQES